MTPAPGVALPPQAEVGRRLDPFLIELPAFAPAVQPSFAQLEPGRQKEPEEDQVSGFLRTDLTARQVYRG
jgi:hypothetical protein